MTINSLSIAELVTQLENALTKLTLVLEEKAHELPLHVSNIDICALFVFTSERY